MTTRLKSLRDWVAQVAQLTSPDRIHWCEGTEQEYRKLLDEMLDSGTLLELNQSTYPGCYLHRSHPEDVARKYCGHCHAFHPIGARVEPPVANH